MRLARFFFLPALLLFQACTSSGSRTGSAWEGQPTVTNAASVPGEIEQEFKRVSFDEFFAGQVVSLPLTLEIPTQYVHAKALEAPLSYAYWMRQEEVAAAARSQDLPTKTGYIYGKLSPNESFDQKTWKFGLENRLEIELRNAGMTLIEKRRFDIKGHPVLSYLVRTDDGTLVGSMFVGTLIETNVLYFGYRPPNNDLGIAQAVWTRINASIR